ncbi:MAG: hypothetical protein MJY87_07750 [Fibrobacter sp.]|nr:hypothetical protein [Fibrobacter sp.]
MFIVIPALADPTVSIFVKDASEFEALKADLSELKASIGQNNEALDSLIAQANRIGEMNDRCGSISISDVLDENCGNFYAVELPEFETRYMEVTGELRLGSMSMASGLEQRTQQIDACVDALSRIIVSKENLLKIEGDVDLEPLSHSGAFDATYNFNLFYDEKKMDQQKHLAEMWLSKCNEIILRKSGDEFAPLFIESIETLNSRMLDRGTNLKIVLEPKSLQFYLDLNRKVAGAYYLSGVDLFDVDAIPSGKSTSHLLVKVKKNSVVLPLGRSAKMQNYKGRVEFEKSSNDLVGRWIWDRDKIKKKIFAKSAKKKDSLESEMERQAQEERSAIEKTISTNIDTDKKSVRWVPLGISTAVTVAGTVLAVVGNSQAKDAYDGGAKTEKELNDAKDKAHSGQTLRTVGIITAIVGAIGIGVSFAF